MSSLRCLLTHPPYLSGRRMFASTPVNAVLRCQETFPMAKPEIDRSGRPRRREATIDVSEGDFRSSPFRREPRENNGRASGFDAREGRGNSSFAKSSNFERGGGSRPFAKKGGFGMKRPTDGGHEEVRRSRGSEGEGYGRDGNLNARASGNSGDFDTRVGRESFTGRSSGRGGFGWKESGSRDFQGSNRGEDGRQDYEQRSGTSRPSMGKEEPRRFDNGRHGQEPKKLDRSSGSHWTAGRPGTRSAHERDTAKHSIPQAEPDQPWAPTKKLTFQAMAGLRALHANDPETFDRHALSQRYGISYDAVTRILRSDYQDRKAKDSGEKIQGTKWDMNPGTSRLSPVRAINKAFGRGQ